MGSETTDFIIGLKDDLNSRNLEEPVYMVGNSAMAYEMSQSFGTESMIIAIVTAIAIYIVVALSFKSWSIPLILVLIIQTAVWVTMSITGLTDGSIYFLSLIIVQSLLMGATIDYAIVGNFASSTAAKICKTISDGTLFSTILILLLLPALMAVCDKIIVKARKNPE